MLVETAFAAGAFVLILICVLCWASNFLMLPGNWGILLIASLHVWLVAGDGSRWQLSFHTLIVLALLAAAGEFAELVAGAAGAARQGGSRRGLILSLVGAAVGSLAGAALGLPIPIPVVGSAVGAVLGGAVGAFCGAAIGEHWKGEALDRQLQVGWAAFLGRILGTVGKLVAGLAMIAVVIVDLVT